MGYYTSLSGEIRIDPPIPHGDLDPSLTEFWEKSGPLRIRVETSRVDTPEGTLERRTGVAVEPYDDETKAYEIEENLQAIVNRYPDRTFTGRIDGEGAGDLWRLIVRDGKAVKAKPTLVWPDRSE